MGLVFSELEYVYAVKKADKDEMLVALGKKNDYKDRIIASSMEKKSKIIGTVHRNKCADNRFGTGRINGI